MFSWPLATNVSYDLVLAQMVFRDVKWKRLIPEKIKKFFRNEFKNLLEHITLNNSSCPATPDVCNVKEMYEGLSKIISTTKFVKKHNEEFKAKKFSGTMNIYLDRSRELEFVDATD
jgi:hypothetical protein